MDVLLVGTNSSSYVITDSTRTITLVGVPSITTANLLYVYNITQGKLYFSPTESLSKAVVSGGNIISVDGTFDVLLSTDEMHIQLTIGDMAYDSGLDTIKTSNQNPDYAYRTSPELIVGFTNQPADIYYYPFSWDTYKFGSLFATGATGAANTLTYTLWATNKFDVDLLTISEFEWDDVTNYLTGAASYILGALTANYEAMHFLDTPLIAEHLMLKVVVVDGGVPLNSLNIYVKKAY